MGFDLDNHWLNRKRFLLYARTFALVYVILTAGVLLHSNLVDPKGYTPGFDFSVFWSAAQLAVQGHPEFSYQLPKLHAIIHTLYPEAREGSYGWFYPPNFFLLITPLGLLPYLPAYLAFMATGLVAYGWVVRKICPGPYTLWVLAGFSGLWDNLVSGQNGFITAALAGAALLTLQQRPVLAGILIGLLSIKPQLLLLFPVALVAARAWKTLGVAALSLVLSNGVATAILGWPSFLAWLGSLGLAKSFLEIGGEHFWLRMPTVFAAAHLMGVSLQGSYLMHAVVAIAVAAVVGGLWWRCQDPTLRYASLTAGSLLISPYVLVYDLTWLALPIAWLARAGQERGWLKWERELLILVWMLPALRFLLAHWVPFQLGPWGAILLLAMTIRRARSEQSLPVRFS